MIRIDAMTDTAEMVEVKASGDRAICSFKHDTVGIASSRSIRDITVPTCTGA